MIRSQILFLLFGISVVNCKAPQVASSPDFVSSDGLVYQGTVVDEKGDILIGVTIALEGLQRGTVTNLYGHFSLDLTEEFIDSDTVQVNINYTGFLPQTKLLCAEETTIDAQIIMAIDPDAFKGGVIGKPRKPILFARIRNGFKKFFHW